MFSLFRLIINLPDFEMLKKMLKYNEIKAAKASYLKIGWVSEYKD